MNIYIYGTKLFKNDLKKLFSIQHFDSNIEIFYIEDMDDIVNKLQNKSKSDIFLIDDTLVYRANKLTQSKYLEKFYRNKIEKSLLEDLDDEVCFDTFDGLIKYILKYTHKEHIADSNGVSDDIGEISQTDDFTDEVPQETQKSPDEITDIDEIEEDMLEDIVDISTKKD